MNNQKLIKFVTSVTILMLIFLTWMEVVRADHVVKERPQVLSSITEFRQCVEFQNKVPLEQVRVIWDVQTAQCFTVLADGRFLTVPQFIKEVEDFAITEEFKEGGI